MTQKLIEVGYWYSKQEPHLPVPHENTDNLTQMEREFVCDYLRSRPIKNYFKGFSLCRICKGINGSTDRSDGTYIWPSGLIHYVRKHHVALPEEFVRKILTKL